MESILNAFRSLGPGRILALFVGLSAIIAISALVINRAQTPGLALLYGGLSAQEANRINDYLASQNIAHEVKGDGAVYVASDKVGELRLQVAGQGMVGGSTAGYELFDNQSAFGTTNFVSNLNAKRALEGELARTIGTIPAVAGARVHIVLPKQNLFSREEVTPSAAVALNLGVRTLTPDQVQSIAQLVAASVPNLSTQNVTVIDQRGTMLFDGRQQNMAASNVNKMRRDVEKSYEDTLVSMIERVVGAGRVSVRVTADVNTDKISENAELFDPAQQVVRSEQTVESTHASSEGGTGGTAGLAGNTPGAGAAGAGGGGSNNENRTETTTNYEISKTVRSLNKEGGEVKKLSVAVLVSGKAAPVVAAPAEGAAPEAPKAPAYVALTDEDKTRLTTLVQAAIGFNVERGDKVEIIDMPFTAEAEAPAVAEPFMSKAQIIQLAEYALMAVALAIVAFMVIRPALGTLNQALMTSVSAPLLQAGHGGGALPSGGAMPMGGPEEGTGGGGMVDIRSVQGRVRESAIKKVGEVVEQYPEESLGVVRAWMGGAGQGERS